MLLTPLHCWPSCLLGLRSNNVKFDLVTLFSPLDVFLPFQWSKVSCFEGEFKQGLICFPQCLVASFRPMVLKLIQTTARGGWGFPCYSSCQSDTFCHHLDGAEWQATLSILWRKHANPRYVIKPNCFISTRLDVFLHCMHVCLGTCPHTKEENIHGVGRVGSVLIASLLQYM